MPNSGHFRPFSTFPYEQILICPRDSPTHLSACSSSNGYMQHVATLNAVSVSLHMRMASMRHQVHALHSKVHLLPVQCGMLGSRTMSRAGMQQRTTSMMSSSIRVHHCACWPILDRQRYGTAHPHRMCWRGRWGGHQAAGLLLSKESNG